ncbi:hypothetical protein JW721_06165 [Candidatus Micrarchaeota archaeon]|nr:hypothetical protein [Candidatus Micrarchaeota archaeon]
MESGDIRPVKVWGQDEFALMRDSALSRCKKGDYIIFRIKGGAQEAGGKFDYMFQVSIELRSKDKTSTVGSALMRGEDIWDAMLLGGTAPSPGVMYDLKKDLVPGVELRMEIKKEMADMMVEAKKLERILDGEGASARGEALGKKFDKLWGKIMDQAMEQDMYKIYMFDGNTGKSRWLKTDFIPSLASKKEEGQKKKLLRA